MTTDNTQAFTLTIADNYIAWLTIDVPGESMNTLQASFVEGVSAVLDQLEGNQSIKGLVIHSGKPDNFVAGADVRMLEACESAEQASEIAGQGQALFSRIEKLPFHVVAAIHGPCLGGGLELALACHSRVATDWDKTRLGLPEVQLGLLPGSGGTQRLPRLIGVPDALDMMLTGKQLRAKKAKKLGVIDDCVPNTVLLDVAEALAQKSKPKRSRTWQSWMLSGNSVGRNLVFDQAGKKARAKTRGNYPAADAILAVVKKGLDKGLKTGFAEEARQFGELVMTPESKSLRSLFFATTAMKKENGADAEPGQVERVGVLGGGLMGAGIAHVSVAKAGYPVRVKDVSEDGILNALRYSYALLNKKRKRKQISKAELQATMMQLSGDTQATTLSNADVVVEAVFEDLSLKHRMVQEMESITSKDAIFATNTSSLPIHQIAEGSQRPEKVVGLHYFSPVEKMPLVEVIPHQGTSDKTISTVVELARKQGKTPIVVGDSAGFYVNRILAPYMNEAARVLLAGETIEHIDNALLDFGFPVGPITLLDEVGIDIGAKIAPILTQELGKRFEAPDVFDVLLNDDRKGRKTGKGFYRYDASKKGSKGKQVDKKIYSLLNIKLNASLSGHEVAQRCALMMLNEAARCLDEGVIRSARDGDIGAIFGIGFPPFLGGPFRYMDHIGIERVVSLLQAHQNRYGERFAPCERLLAMAKEGDVFYPDTE
ncbi:multifunctional fatty acid oxidation complex subunit alpha [Salinivibrio sp. MA440]|uniref:fatty acid oxidation complex subunit alpha FadJ n=1 Tax=Salinivibrio sp. MA440 TaxID=1909456 RepID=UPI0009893608|nr:fatty acid oxidation complex subunit alpha FadJ [Salinivibrio sp. MA440]OOF07047.1 multifunctional fatty acid oxidation complex subunit alpha [Salinivibrio sp. MA440]